MLQYDKYMLYKFKVYWSTPENWCSLTDVTWASGHSEVFDECTLLRFSHVRM